MMRTAAAAVLLLLAACGTSPETSVLDLFDRLDWLREKYNSTLNALDFAEQARVEVALARDAQQYFDVLVEESTRADDMRRRYLATFALGFSKRAEAGLPLRARLDDVDPIIRVTAAVALAHLGVPNPPIDRVVKMLDEPTQYVRLGALFSLKLMLAPGQDAGLSRRLIALLDDPSPDIRNEAIHVMARARRLEYLQPLVAKSFKDENLLIRFNAAMTVGSFGPAAEEAVPHLIELLKDLEARVVEAAWWALKKVTGKDFDRSYHMWRDWYEEQLRRYEYFCPTHPEVVRDVAGFCAQCGAKLQQRLRPIKPPGDEGAKQETPKNGDHKEK